MAKDKYNLLNYQFSLIKSTISLILLKSKQKHVLYPLPPIFFKRMPEKFG